MPHWIRIYLVPAAVMQAVIMGGGYGTGREAVEFVTQAGPTGGLWAVAFFFIAITAVTMVSFEFARTFRVYDYRRFFQQILGSAWWLYEILVMILFVLVLAVVISASAAMADSWFGIPMLATTIGIMLVTMIVLYAGQQAVEGLLTAWAAFFSAFLLLVVVFAVSQQPIVPVEGDWPSLASLKGFQYALYNLAAIPVLLYTLRHIRNRKQALLAGLIAGTATTIPALLMHIVLTPHLPNVLDEALPMMFLIDTLEISWVAYVYAFLLIGTIVQTAIGALEGVVQRIDGMREDQGKTALSSGVRGGLGGLVLLLASGASTVGVVALIGSGYGTLAWGFLALYAIPVLTIGTWKLWRAQPTRPES